MREKIFLPATVAVCVLIVLAWYQFLYAPTQREILSMQLETRKLRELEREIHELKARHGNLSSLVAAKELELDAARNFLPTTLEQDKFIDTLYRAADTTGAGVMSVQTSGIIQAEDIQAQVVTVKLEAQYVQLLNFIREVLDGSRLTELQNFSVEASGGRILSCTLNFRIFAEPPAKKP